MEQFCARKFTQKRFLPTGKGGMKLGMPYLTNPESIAAGEVLQVQK